MQNVFQAFPCRPTATPGRYQAALGNLTPGTYTVTAEAGVLGRAERKLVVEAGGAELAQLTLQEGTLREIARAGRGQYAPLSQAAELLEKLPSAASAQRQPAASHPGRNGWLLGAVLALCTLEWALRRRWGV